MDFKKEIKGNIKDWRKVKSKERFLNAFRGICVFCASTRHLVAHLVIALIVIIFGFYFQISSMQWIAIVFAIGFVLVAEIFNTAIEIDIDLTSPEYHPYARDTKDVAAGAVLFASLVAFIIGLIIFLPLLLAKI